MQDWCSDVCAICGSDGEHRTFIMRYEDQSTDPTSHWSNRWAVNLQATMNNLGLRPHDADNWCSVRFFTAEDGNVTDVTQRPLDIKVMSRTNYAYDDILTTSLEDACTRPMMRWHTRADEAVGQGYAHPQHAITTESGDTCLPALQRVSDFKDTPAGGKRGEIRTGEMSPVYEKLLPEQQNAFNQARANKKARMLNDTPYSVKVVGVEASTCRFELRKTAEQCLGDGMSTPAPESINWDDHVVPAFLPQYVGSPYHTKPKPEKPRWEPTIPDPIPMKPNPETGAQRDWI